MKLTSREKIMIGVLLLVLIAAVLVLVLRSYSTKIDNKQAELDALTVEANGIRSAVEGVERMQAEIPALQESTKGLKQQLNSIQKNREFDSEITALAVNCGLKPISLNIGERENGQIEPYISLDGAEKSGGDTDAQAAESYIWSNSADFVAEGTVEELYSFLDAIAADAAMRVSGLSYEAPARTNGVTEFNITIEMYMYDKDGTA